MKSAENPTIPVSPFGDTWQAKGQDWNQDCISASTFQDSLQNSKLINLNRSNHIRYGTNKNGSSCWAGLSFGSWTIEPANRASGLDGTCNSNRELFGSWQVRILRAHVVNRKLVCVRPQVRTAQILLRTSDYEVPTPSNGCPSSLATICTPGQCHFYIKTAK